MARHERMESVGVLAAPRLREGLQPDERLGTSKAPRTIDEPTLPSVPKEAPIAQWDRPGLDPALRASLRGPFAFKLQRANTIISAANPAWSKDPTGDAFRLAELLGAGWVYVKGRGPGDSSLVSS
jgi:hypothetical protein